MAYSLYIVRWFPIIYQKWRCSAAISVDILHHFMKKWGFFFPSFVFFFSFLVASQLGENSPRSPGFAVAFAGFAGRSLTAQRGSTGQRGEQDHRIIGPRNVGQNIWRKKPWKAMMKAMDFWAWHFLGWQMVESSSGFCWDSSWNHQRKWSHLLRHSRSAQRIPVLYGSDIHNFVPIRKSRWLQKSCASPRYHPGGVFRRSWTWHGRLTMVLDMANCVHRVLDTLPYPSRLMKSPD